MESLPDALELTVQVPPTTGPAPPERNLPADDLTLDDDVIALDKLGLDESGALATGFTVRFTANLLTGTDAVTESLDGMELVVDYTPARACTLKALSATQPRVVRLSSGSLPVVATVQFDDQPCLPTDEVTVRDWQVR